MKLTCCQLCSWLSAHTAEFVFWIFIGVVLWLVFAIAMVLGLI